MTFNQPPGHVPGFHAPGTTIPLGYIQEVEANKRQFPPTPAPHRPFTEEEVRTFRDEIDQGKEKRERARLEESKKRDECIERLAGIRNPVERLVAAITFFSAYWPGDSTGRKPTITCDAEALKHLRPDLWPTGRVVSLGTNPPWDHVEVSKWFRGNVKVAPRQDVRMSKKGLFGYKEIRRSAWIFKNGSVCLIDRGDQKSFKDLVVSVNTKPAFGEVIPLEKRYNGFNAIALQKMAGMCAITFDHRDELRPQPMPVSSNDLNSPLGILFSVMASVGEKSANIGKVVPNSHWIEAT
jgi:hypothetical protein